MLRIGHGFDVHAFAEGRRLVLGGVDVPCERGLAGHSTRTSLPTPSWTRCSGAMRGGTSASSSRTPTPPTRGGLLVLMSRVVGLRAALGFGIQDVDCTVAAQAPKLAPYREQMRERMAAALGVPVEHWA